MKLRCILCGRTTQPAVMLADKPVGPKCARKAGLLNIARRGRGQVRLASPQAKKADEHTLDLFSEAFA